MTTTEHVEVLVVGAGLSGVAAGYYLQTYSPGRSYAILEARDAMGGTWDLFRYPGIRSDSDMFTLGYSFRPWREDKAIADGGAILQYIKDTAAEFGVDKRIRYGHRVLGASWSSEDALWTVDVERGGERIQITANFVISCAGYYDYDEGHDPQFEGRDDFKGEVVHPQFWPEDLDYADKKVVVIGSGATAVTVVPAMAETAEKVTMLQRSPTYMLSAPSTDKMANWLRDNLPNSLGPHVSRWKGVLLSMAIYNYCQTFPQRARKLLMDGIRQQVPDDFDVDVHFNPRYNPWDQRLCLVPHGDLFKSIKEGKADVVTDQVERFTETGVLLSSGKELEADIIVTATGLKVRLLGGITAKVDGRDVKTSETMCYRGTMFSEIPNFAMVIGYTNASWTLKCELVLNYVTRLLNHMDDKGYRSVVPEQNDPSITEEPLLDMDSGYFMRVRDQLPKNGSKMPWKLYQNYVLDKILMGRGAVDDGKLKFRKAPPPRVRKTPSAAAE